MPKLTRHGSQDLFEQKLDTLRSKRTSEERIRLEKKVKARNCRKLVIKFFFWTVVVLCAIGIVLLAIFAYREEVVENVELAYLFAGAFVLLTIPLTFHHVRGHLQHWFEPVLQACVVRILFMVPIYAVESYIALRWKESAIICAFLREFYEAYVIYNFFNYLLHFLGSVAVDPKNPYATMERVGATQWHIHEPANESHPEDSDMYLDEVEELSKLLCSKPPVHHLMPLCYVKPWPPGKSFLRRCQYGVLQYVYVRVVTTVLSIVLYFSGDDMFRNGDFAWDAGYPYIAFANNMSQIWAMYCLILFYHATKEELAPVRPMAKLVCIKAIVFFSFWQSIGIAAMTHFHLITTTLVTPRGEGDNGQAHRDEEILTQEELGEALNNFIICIEMFIACLAHRFAFPLSEFKYKKGAERTLEEQAAGLTTDSDKKSLMRAFFDTVLPSEVAGDTAQLGKTALKRIRRAMQGKDKEDGSSSPTGWELEHARGTV